MTPRRHLVLGLFFLTVVGVLGYYTLFRTDVSLFGEKTRVVAFVDNAGGLRKGAPVLYAGVRWGQVEEVVPDIDRPRAERVRIVLTLDQPIRLFEDHTAVIEAASVLGGVQLSLDPGTTGLGELDTTLPLKVRRTPDVLAAAGALLDENREPIKRAFAGIEELVTSIRSGNSILARLFNDESLGQEFANAVASVSGTFTNTEALTDEIRGGRGTLGRIIYDPELFDDIKNITEGVKGFVEDARAFVAEARTGQGIVALLMNDSESAGDFKASLASVRSVVDKVDKGEGTLGRLVNDGAIADSVQSAADDISAFVSGIREGEGSVAKLFNDGALYDNFRTFSEDLVDISSAIRDQTGTIGRLVYDDTVVRQLERVFNTLQGSLEEAREAAPIATFLATIFLGF
jgi:phospholipid/cholesterol/gamma-HCH transport system substrate-binding protein